MQNQRFSIHSLTGFGISVGGDGRYLDPYYKREFKTGGAQDVYSHGLSLGELYLNLKNQKVTRPDLNIGNNRSFQAEIHSKVRDLAKSGDLVAKKIIKMLDPVQKNRPTMDDIANFFSSPPVSKEKSIKFSPDTIEYNRKSPNSIRQVGPIGDYGPSRQNPDLKEDYRKAKIDMKYYNLIREKFSREELLKFKGKESEEIFEILKDSGRIKNKDLDQIRNRGLDLDGSPYW